MRFNALTGYFEIPPEKLQSAGHSLIYALRHVRELARLPLEPYEVKGALTHADHAQKGIIDAAAKVGIHLGAEWGNEIDVRQK